MAHQRKKAPIEKENVNCELSPWAAPKNFRDLYCNTYTWSYKGRKALKAKPRRRGKKDWRSRCKSNSEYFCFWTTRCELLIRVGSDEPKSPRPKRLPAGSKMEKNGDARARRRPQWKMSSPRAEKEPKRPSGEHVHGHARGQPEKFSFS